MFEHIFIDDKTPDMIPLLGIIAPLLISLIAIISLRNRPPYAFAYILFYIINHIINHLMKDLIKQNRPVGGKSILTIENYEGTERYGMPSAHMQSIGFSIMFLYLVKHQNYILFIELILASLTMYQRFTFRRHTMEQLITGALVGVSIAYIGVYLTDKFLTKQ